MLVDWFTVAAQIVNFLILVGLLKHFLYGRIIRAMDEREQGIRERLEGAERREAEAQEQAAAYRRKTEELEEERRQALEEAREQAEEQRKAMVEEARADTERQRERWQSALEAEKQGLVREIRRLSTGHAYEAARRALGDLADAGVEERMAELFLARFKDAEAEALEELGKAARSDDGRVVVRSRFEMPGTMRQKITRAFHERLGREIEVAYEASGRGLAGVELRARGRRVAWGLDAYLTELEEEAEKALDRAVRQGGRKRGKGDDGSRG